MIPTIEQLQEIYKAIYGTEAGDIHRLRAAHHFNVAYLDVTPEQRMIGKKINFPGLYNSQTSGEHHPVQLQNIRRTRSYKSTTNWSYGSLR